MADQFRQAEMPLHELGMHRSIPDPRDILRSRKIIRSFCPDVVHSHMVHANLLARLTRVVCPMPVLIVTVQSLTERRRWTKLAWRVTESIGGLATIIRNAIAEAHMRIGSVPAFHLAKRIRASEWQADNLGVV